jgi:hypothetical protein
MNPLLVALWLQAGVLTAADLAGTWAGQITHDGRSTPYALELEPAGEGKVSVKLSIPVIHVRQMPIGERPLVVEGAQVKLGASTVLRYDASEGTLTGVIPEALAPVYTLPVTLRRVPKLELPARPEIDAPLANPTWTFQAGVPL